jgi:hypothetical protein
MTTENGEVDGPQPSREHLARHRIGAGRVCAGDLDEQRSRAAKGATRSY